MDPWWSKVRGFHRDFITLSWGFSGYRWFSSPKVREKWCFFGHPSTWEKRVGSRWGYHEDEVGEAIQGLAREVARSKESIDWFKGKIKGNIPWSSWENWWFLVKIFPSTNPLKEVGHARAPSGKLSNSLRTGKWMKPWPLKVREFSQTWWFSI